MLKTSVPKAIWKRLAVIGGLSAVAFVAPLLDIYGKNPEIFVANRTGTLEIFVFAIGVALFLPLIAWVVLALTGAIGDRASVIAYRVMVAILALAGGLVVSRQVLGDNTWGAIALTVVIAALIWWLVGNLDLMFVIAAVAIPLFVFMFLGTSATARLIWEEPEAPVGSVSVGNPAHIVMFQLDEFPLASIVDTDGTINEALFPNFARLAKEGTWYRNALSNSIATTQSVPAILTGVLGDKDEKPTVADHPDNLFTLLGGVYDMHVIEWVADMCPEETCPDYAGRAPARFTSLVKDLGVVYGHLTLPGTMRESLPSIDNAWEGFLGQSGGSSGANVDIDGLPLPPGNKRQEWINWVQRLINGIAANTGPTLSYAHLQSPHVPWTVNPSGTHYERPEEGTEVNGLEGDGHWSQDPDAALLGLQRHLYQVGFLDTMLGRMLDRLEETGTWDDTMVVVIADHGESFVPGEHRRWPYENNREDLYRIPLFIKYPGQTTGETVDLPAFGIDVLPTIVDALDIDTDWRFDGVSLLELTTVRPHRPIFWCCNGEGVSTDLDELFSQAERNHSWIPDQTSWLGVASVGEHADLVGTSSRYLKVSSDDSFQWSLDLGSSLDDVDLSSGIVQTLITGRVEANHLPDSDDVLVVVNDMIAGVAHLSRDGATGGAIIGLITEEAVHDGANAVDLLIADDNGGWVAGENRDLSLDLVAGDGHPIQIGVERNKQIQVDSIVETDTGWEVSGWAADVSAKVAPDMFYVFAGDELLASGPPNVDNSNVVRWFDSDNLLRSGFSFDIPSGDVPAEADRLLVVAEFGNEAIADATSLTR